MTSSVTTTNNNAVEAATVAVEIALIEVAGAAVTASDEVSLISTSV